MCLYVKSRKPKVAKEDIVCYKVLELHYGKPYLVTPYFFASIFPNVLSGEEACEPDAEKFEIRRNNDEYYRIEGGSIHTFKHFTDAKKCSTECECPKIYKVIIPKGTQYFEGYTDGGHRIEGYASKQIVFKEKIMGIYTIDTF